MMGSSTVVVGEDASCPSASNLGTDFLRSLSAQPSRIQPMATKGGTIGAQFQAGI
jgi:hypothetical protein